MARFHSLCFLTPLFFVSLSIAKTTSSPDSLIHNPLSTPGKNDKNLRIEVADLLKRRPPPVVVVSYGRKSRDQSVNQIGVSASLKTMLEKCKPPPEIKYVDDIEPAQLAEHLRAQKFPEGSIYLVNAHGRARVGSSGKPEGLDLVVKANGNRPSNARSAEDVVKSLLEAAAFSNVWLSACKSGACDYF